ncbi:uncharacterized protein LOC112567274 [Pomacea canaliculata]|nr:uncharacterized protein LOC112567274 [Pomacea canaliculata]
MATSWIQEEDTLADMRQRLDRLRGQKARDFKEEEEDDAKPDTLKILQSKFGSPVYDPTSPMQIAYDRRCSRAGRRKSIEFEDLCLASGRLHLSSARSGHHRTQPTKDPATSEAQTANQQASPVKQKHRRISDPTVPNRRKLLAARHHGTGQGDGQDNVGHIGRGILGMTLGKEERQKIDERLAGIADPDPILGEGHAESSIVSRKHKAK